MSVGVIGSPSPSTTCLVITTVPVRSVFTNHSQVTLLMSRAQAPLSSSERSTSWNGSMCTAAGRSGSGV